MKNIFHVKYLPVASLICVIGFVACKKQINASIQQVTEDKAAVNGTVSGNTTVNVTGVCDYIF
jgi:hypothetical protein